MRDALDLLSKKVAKVIANLSAFALKWKGKFRSRSTDHDEHILGDICSYCN